MSTTALHSFKVEFDPNSQEFALSGVMRPRSADEICRMHIDAQRRNRRGAGRSLHQRQAPGTDEQHGLSRLRARPSRCLSHAVGHSLRRRDFERRGLTERMFAHLEQDRAAVTVEVYDSKFYPGQSFVEKHELYPDPAHANETDLRHERTILPRPWPAPGYDDADICCASATSPCCAKGVPAARIVALDHSKAKPRPDARDVASGIRRHGYRIYRMAMLRDAARG